MAKRDLARDPTGPKAQCAKLQTISLSLANHFQLRAPHPKCSTFVQCFKDSVCGMKSAVIPAVVAFFYFVFLRKA
jgi:hypothetical protein